MPRQIAKVAAKADPDRFKHAGSGGRRVPGWEQWNVTALARDIGVRPEYLARVLTGRGESMGSMRLLKEIAVRVGVTVGELIDMIYPYSGPKVTRKRRS